MSVRTDMLLQLADIAEQYAREHGTGVTVTEFAAHLRATAQADEKSIPAGVQPVEDVATHRHPRPCHLPEASFLRARKRGRIGDYFAGVKQGHDDRPIWVGETW
ncbi:hypothetical protein ACFWIK_00655 [Streptomyces anthocyanicus]|uniref:hypothetical protein n=1 Tax=Streptomyces anthocyanicus TaxID=68174 RepID=UPI00365AC6E5